MPRYLIERTFDDGGARQALTAKHEHVVQGNAEARVTWLHSYINDDGRLALCVYEAPNPEAIRRAARISGLPIDRILRVSTFDPSQLSDDDGSRDLHAIASPVKQRIRTQAESRRSQQTAAQEEVS